MPVIEGDPPVVVSPALQHETAGYAVTQICLGSHSGTHLDAPRHLYPGLPTLDEYPIDRFVRPGVVVDARPARALPEKESEFLKTPGVIDAEFLAARLQDCPVETGGFVLLWTAGAVLTVAAGQLLVESGATLVGTDATSLDDPPFPVHRLLLSHDMLIAENLAGFESVGPGLVTCAFLPLPVVNTDGAPIRAIAWRS